MSKYINRNSLPAIRTALLARFPSKAITVRCHSLTIAISTALALGSAPAVAEIAFPATIILDGLNGSNGFRLEGDIVDQSGFSVAAAGDVNGDGLDDLIVGTLRSSSGVFTGRSYVVFGSNAGFSPVLALSDLDGGNGFRLENLSQADASGFSVSGAGDVNGDGVDDLLIGAPRATPNVDQSGSSYVVFGQRDGFSALLDLGKLDGSDGFRIDGAEAGDFSGSVAGAGDINGDGIDDLLIGARYADPNGNTDAGSAYVVFGNSGGFSASLNLDSLNGSDGFALAGVMAGDNLGYAVAAAGDINGDGNDDLVIGALRAEPNGPASGRSYVVFGTNTGFAAEIDLSGLDGTNGFALDGAVSGDASGSAVAAVGDVNNDGIDDLLIGARGASPNGESRAGRSYLVFGSNSNFPSTLPLTDVDGNIGFVLEGISTQDNSGRSVAGAGDVNGDGIDDLLIGAPNADPDGTSATGSSYIIFGSEDGFAATFALSGLNGSNGFAMEGGADGDQAGRSVSGAGDVNGDGIDDIIVGAPYSANLLQGTSYVVFGSDLLYADEFESSAPATSR